MSRFPRLAQEVPLLTDLAEYDNSWTPTLAQAYEKPLYPVMKGEYSTQIGTLLAQSQSSGQEIVFETQRSKRRDVYTTDTPTLDSPTDTTTTEIQLTGAVLPEDGSISV